MADGVDVIDAVEPVGPSEVSDAGRFRLIACPQLSHERRIDRYLVEGSTIGQYLRELGWRTEWLSARVFIDGQYIPDVEWETARPVAGQAVVIRSIPQGGEGGGGGKQIGRIVGLLALVVAAGFTAGGALAGVLPALAGSWTTAFLAGGIAAKLGAGAILIGGSLALNALIPPARPRLGELSGQGNSSSALSLTGSSNQLTPYGRIPRVYGRHRIYPPLAAKPYTEVAGNGQFLRLLFCFGYGPLVISDIRIGETPIGQFKGVTMELRQGFPSDPPIELVPDDVIEDNISTPLTAAGGFIQRTSGDSAKALSVDIAFPAGLIFYDPNSNGRHTERTVQLEVEYRKVGNVPWIPVGGAAAVAASVTTDFAGANNDLVLTMRSAGAAGNVYSVRFDRGPSLFVEHSIAPIYQRGEPTAALSYSINIRVVQGVTTAAALKAALEANTAINNLILVAHAPGNNGTGAITLPLESVTERFQAFGKTFIFRGGLNAVPTFVVTAISQTLVRRSLQWTVNEPGNAFEVRVRRITADVEQGAIRDEVYWTTFRTVQESAPINKTGLCLLALRIQASDQLNGTVDTLNAIAESILLDWDGTDWVPRVSNNPASVYRDVLQGTANRRPKPDSSLDLPVIQDFHERCATNGYAFNAIIDFQTTVKQLRQDVLAAGRGAFGMRDMKYSVIQDLPQAIPVDVITPRTSSGFKWQKRFLDMPHGLRVRFVDEVNNYKQGEDIVYTDGYDAGNATIFEEQTAGLGVTTWAQVYKLKRHELKEAALRADDYDIRMDFAQINFTRGDRVQLQQDVILAGLVSGRIQSVTLNGSNEATAITFDEPLVMGAGIDYGARIRRSDGTQVVRQVVTVVGTQSSATFTTPIPVGSVPAVGDLVPFGELGRDTLDCIVKSIEPGDDYSATVSLLDYAPAIHDAASEPTPPYDPHITLPTEEATPIPTIVQVLSDESVLVRDQDGALQSRILVSVHFPSGFRLPVTRIESQHKIAGSDDDWRQIFTAVSGTSVEVAITPVEDNASYDVRLRTVDDHTGQTSAWATIDAHQVVGKSSPPPDVRSLVIEGDRLRWNYPDPPRDLAGFLVRFRPGTSRLWDSATPAHDHVILTTDFVVIRLGGVQTFLVKAVDVAGNESLNAQTVTVNLGGTLLENVLISTDHRALGWPGTKTNATILSGDLAANSSTPFWTSDPGPFWIDPDSRTYWVGSYGEMTYEFSFSPPVDLLDATLKLDIAMLGDWALEYRTDSTNLMWNVDANVLMWNASAATLMWAAKGDYLSWGGELSPLSQQQYDFRITGAAGAVQAVLQQLKIILDVPDVIELFPDFVVASGGTRPTLTKTFREIVVVQMDLQEDGGTAAYVKAMDKNVAPGPLIQAFDSVNSPASALVDVVVQGY